MRVITTIEYLQTALVWVSGLYAIYLLSRYFFYFNRNISLVMSLINFMIIIWFIYLHSCNIIVLMGTDYKIAGIDLSLHKYSALFLLNIFLILIIPISAGFLIRSKIMFLGHFEIWMVTLLLFPVFHKILIIPIRENIYIYCLFYAYISGCSFMLYKLFRGENDFSPTQVVVFFIRSLVLIIILRTIGSDLLAFVIYNAWFLWVVFEDVITMKLSISDALSINLPAKFGRGSNAHGVYVEILSPNAVGMHPEDWTDLMRRFRASAVSQHEQLVAQSDYKKGFAVNVKMALEGANASKFERDCVHRYFRMYCNLMPQSVPLKTVYNGKHTKILDAMDKVNSL